MTDISVFVIVAPIRYAARKMWDSFMFHAVIKTRGRVPTSEGFLVKRVNKGGAVEMVYYQVAVIFENILSIYEVLNMQDDSGAVS